MIFVQGAPRSGTTWLVNLLATHPEIAGVEAESHLFGFGVDRLFDNFENRNPLHSGCLNQYVEDRQRFIDLVREFCDGVLLSMRESLGVDADSAFVVEKTPTKADEASLDLLRKRECYPDARYLHIVRDGEAVTRSLMGAKWMGNRSRAECERTWRVAVDSTRKTLADHSGYREIRYEELVADPAGQSAELFQWLGVDSGPEVLEAVALLSQERFSDRGVVPVLGTRPGWAVLQRHARSAIQDARAGLATAKRTIRKRRLAKGSDLAFWFVTSMRDRDEERLRSLTAESFALEYRTPQGDLLSRGDDARAGLLRIANELYSPRPVNEWWASAGGGVSDWWTMVPGRPLWTLLFSSLGGDASRTDVAFGLFMDNDQITRVVVISAGPLSGRSLRTLPEVAAASAGN